MKIDQNISTCFINKSSNDVFSGTSENDTDNTSSSLISNSELEITQFQEIEISCQIKVKVKNSKENMFQYTLTNKIGSTNQKYGIYGEKTSEINKEKNLNIKTKQDYDFKEQKLKLNNEENNNFNSFIQINPFKDNFEIALRPIRLLKIKRNNYFQNVFQNNSENLIFEEKGNPQSLKGLLKEICNKFLKKFKQTKAKESFKEIRIKLKLDNANINFASKIFKVENNLVDNKFHIDLNEIPNEVKSNLYSHEKEYSNQSKRKYDDDSINKKIRANCFKCLSNIIKQKDLFCQRFVTSTGTNFNKNLNNSTIEDILIDSLINKRFNKEKTIEKLDSILESLTNIKDLLKLTFADFYKEIYLFSKEFKKKLNKIEKKEPILYYRKYFSSVYNYVEFYDQVKENTQQK